MKQIDHWYDKPAVWKRIALLLSIILYQFGYDCIILKYFVIDNKFISGDKLLACIVMPIFSILIFVLIAVAIMAIFGWILQGNKYYFFYKLEKWLTKIFK